MSTTSEEYLASFTVCMYSSVGMYNTSGTCGDMILYFVLTYLHHVISLY